MRFYVNKCAFNGKYIRCGNVYSDKLHVARKYFLFTINNYICPVKK